MADAITVSFTQSPTAPNRLSDSADTYAPKMDDFLGWMESHSANLADFVPEMNAAVDQVNADAAAADDAANTAASAANFKGPWSNLTGSLSVPASVAHSGSLWVLLTDLADVTASEPGVSGDWHLLGMSQLSDDTTPQLGGDLDGQGNKIHAAQVEDIRETILSVGTIDAADVDAVATSQSLGSAGSLTLDGAKASDGVAEFTSPRIVTIDSDGDDSGLTWTVTGTDKDGNSQSESVSGANAGQATSSNYYLTVTDIAADGATATTVTSGQGDAALLVNWRQPINEVTIGANITALMSTGATSGARYMVTLKLTNPGAYSWPTSATSTGNGGATVKAPGGGYPSFTSSGTDNIPVYVDDGGTTVVLGSGQMDIAEVT